MCLADKVTGTEQEKAEAAKHFAEINHAYETLSDGEKRQIYDQYGEEGLKQHAGQQVGPVGRQHTRNTPAHAVLAWLAALSTAGSHTAWQQSSFMT